MCRFLVPWDEAVIVALKRLGSGTLTNSLLLRCSPARERHFIECSRNLQAGFVIEPIIKQCGVELIWFHHLQCAFHSRGGAVAGVVKIWLA